jgi:hypothetical protein
VDDRLRERRQLACAKLPERWRWHLGCRKGPPVTISV